MVGISTKFVSNLLDSVGLLLELVGLYFCQKSFLTFVRCLLNIYLAHPYMAATFFESRKCQTRFDKPCLLLQIVLNFILGT